MNLFIRALIILTFTITVLPVIPAYSANPVKIGVLAFRPKPQTLEQWQPLAVGLKQAMPGRDFIIEALTYPEMNAAVTNRQLDFVFTNPGHFVLLKMRGGLSAPLATLAVKVNGQRCNAFGGVIFSRAEHTNINTLNDLKGKTIAVPDSESLGGYQMQAYELNRVGVRLPKDAKLLVTGMPHDNVVKAVLEGRADAGFVRSGVLEGAAREGKLDIKQLKILNLQNPPEFPLQVSTRLYPEWPFSALSHIDESLARHVAAALFTLGENTSLMQAMHIHGFSVPSDYTPVEEMLRELRFPPFDVVPAFTLKDVWVRYRWQTISTLLAITLITLLSFRLFLTKRKLQAEQQTVQLQTKKLQESESRLRTILDTEPECIKMLDSECNLIMMNQAGLEMIEADSFEQVKGKCLCPLITDPYRDAFMALTKQVFQGNTGTLQFETIGLKGRHLWMETHAVPFRNEQGEITALLGITRNITESKQSDEKLKASEENYRNLTGLTSDYVHRCSRVGLNPFRIQWIGGSVDSISGYSAEEVYEFGCWLPLVHPDDRQEVMTYLFSLLPGDFKQIEFRILTKEGQISWIQETSRCVVGEKEDELILFGSAKNITELKMAELERDNLAKQLLYAQKLESMGVLAGGIAHDFNNILTSIIGNADLALMRINPESPAIDNLNRIGRAAARAADLAKQMLAYSGKGQFFIKYLDMNQLLKETVHLLEVSISKKVELRFNLSSSLPSVEADVTQIQQIIMNLVINASEAIGDQSGVISIATGTMECDKKYLGAFWQSEDISAGEYVYLEISDTGCGMDKETQEKIFDPFFTTKFTGRGLGMAAVHGIIRGHKGAINISSELNKGSSFKIFLPASGKPLETCS